MVRDIFGMMIKVVWVKLIGIIISEIEILFVVSFFIFECYYYGGGMIFGFDGKFYIIIGECFFWECDELFMLIV